MPVEIYRCEYCGEDFEDEYECRLHESICEDNPDREPMYPPPFTESPCRCCARSWMTGFRLHWPLDCPELYVWDEGWRENPEVRSGDEKAGGTVCPRFRADKFWYWNALDAAERRLIPQGQKP